jgi:hypothetical protein
VHRDVLAALSDPGRIGFVFGRFGRCRLRIEPEGGGRS